MKLMIMSEQRNGTIIFSGGTGGTPVCKAGAGIRDVFLSKSGRGRAARPFALRVREPALFLFAHPACV